MLGFGTNPGSPDSEGSSKGSSSDSLGDYIQLAAGMFFIVFKIKNEFTRILQNVLVRVRTVKLVRTRPS